MDIDGIIKRFKVINKLKRHKELAKLFDISPQDFSQRKNRGTILDLIIDHPSTKQINLHWLLTGEGPMRMEGMPQIPVVKEEPPPYSSLDPKTDEILQLTREIMQSGTSYAEALSTNVIHFHRAVLAERKIDGKKQDIAALVEKLNEAVENLRIMGPPGFVELLELASNKFSLQAVLNLFLERVMKATGAKIGSILLKDPSTGNFRVAVAKSEGDGPKRDEIIRIENSVMRIAVDEMEPLVVEDISKHPGIEKPNDPRYGSPSFMSVPIVERDECQGVINLAGKDQRLAFSQGDKGIVIKMLPDIIAALSKRGGVPNGIFNH